MIRVVQKRAKSEKLFGTRFVYNNIRKRLHAMGTFWRNLLSEHVLFTITFVNACTHRRQRWEPFVRARFVYNNIRKRLHTPLSTVGTF